MLLINVTLVRRIRHIKKKRDNKQKRSRDRTLIGIEIELKGNKYFSMRRRDLYIQLVSKYVTQISMSNSIVNDVN